MKVCSEKRVFINVLGSSNQLLIRTHEGFLLRNLDEVFKLYTEDKTIEIPFVDSSGIFLWKKLEKISCVGSEKTRKIMLGNGMYFSSVGSQEVPVINNVTRKKTNIDFKLRFKEIKNLERKD
jgi:hypothetical protein